MKTLQQKYKGAHALYTASKYGVDIVDTGGTWSNFDFFIVVCRKGKRIDTAQIKLQDDGLAYINIFGDKIMMKEFRYNYQHGADVERADI